MGLHAVRILLRVSGVLFLHKIHVIFLAFSLICDIV